MSRFERALRCIDDAHAEDPNLVTSPVDGRQVPYELHYAEKMTRCLEQRDPGASETLRLAVRAQHLRRWEVPRSSYPATKAGYLAWRSFLKNRQAEQAEKLCLNCGYSVVEAGRVATLIRKENMRSDPETQVLEDVACLVFLDDQLEEFEKGYDEEKIIGILKKTWGKMTDRGHELALKIELSDRAKALVAKALEQ